MIATKLLKKKIKILESQKIISSAFTNSQNIIGQLNSQRDSKVRSNGKKIGDLLTIIKILGGDEDELNKLIVSAFNNASSEEKSNSSLSVNTNWEKHTNTNSGSNYWYNPTTQESRWANVPSSGVAPRENLRSAFPLNSNRQLAKTPSGVPPPQTPLVPPPQTPLVPPPQTPSGAPPQTPNIYPSEQEIINAFKANSQKNSTRKTRKLVPNADAIMGPIRLSKEAAANAQAAKVASNAQARAQGEAQAYKKAQANTQSWAQGEAQAYKKAQANAQAYEKAQAEAKRAANAAKAKRAANAAATEAKRISNTVARSAANAEAARAAQANAAAKKAANAVARSTAQPAIRAPINAGALVAAAARSTGGLVENPRGIFEVSTNRTAPNGFTGLDKPKQAQASTTATAMQKQLARSQGPNLSKNPDLTARTTVRSDVNTTQRVVTNPLTQMPAVVPNPLRAKTFNFNESRQAELSKPPPSRQRQPPTSAAQSSFPQGTKWSQPLTAPAGNPNPSSLSLLAKQAGLLQRGGTRKHTSRMTSTKSRKQKKQHATRRQVKPHKKTTRRS